MKKIIYVSGMPRAMTTLMCNVLANDPRIGGGETSPLLDIIYAAKNAYAVAPEARASLDKQTMHGAFKNFCKCGMEGYAKLVTTKPIYLDKSRGWIHYYPLLSSIQDNPKVIVMVRDLRDIVASFEQKWRQNPFDLDFRDDPSKLNFITLNQRVNHFLNEPPIGISLMRIKNAIDNGNINKMLVIRAEDFTANPSMVMTKVYHFIDEKKASIDYNNVKQMTIENEREQDYTIYGDHKIRPKIERLVSKASTILGTDIYNQIKTEYNWYFKQFGYE